MSIYKSFGTDKTAELAGVWVDVGFKDGDETKPIRFKIARQGAMNKKFQACVDKKVAPYRQLIAMEQVQPEVINKILLEVFCESIILGWENVDNEEGDALLEFNYKNAVWLFKKLPDLYELLNAKSKATVTFKDDSLKVVVKN